MPDPTRWTRVHLEADAREPFAPAFQRRVAGLVEGRLVAADRLSANRIARRVLAGLATGSILTWLATGSFW